MKVYGLACAAMPDKHCMDIVTATCTSVAVTDGNKESFEMPHKLKFTYKFTDLAASIGNFLQMFGILKSLVEMQKQSFAEQGLPYRPVPLNLGKDSRNPIMIDMFFAPIFGRIFTIETGQKQKVNRITRRNIAGVLNQRVGFLSVNPAMLAELQTALEELPELLDKCTLCWGSYHPGEEPKLEQTELDKTLLRLRPAFEAGDRAAHMKIRELALNEGCERGVQVTGKSTMFGLPSPKGYAANKEMQEQFPRFDFYHWHPDFKRDFHIGFGQFYRGKYNRRIRLPLDEPSPPFADPCADMVRDQYDILRGKRDADNIRDEPEDRRRIALAAKEAAEALSALIEGENVIISGWRAGERVDIFKPESIQLGKQLGNGGDRAK